MPNEKSALPAALALRQKQQARRPAVNFFYEDIFWFYTSAAPDRLQEPD
jgi:hypothetical protein